MDYKKKAIECVKDTVLPVHMKQFQECGCSLDEQYKKYGDTEYLTAKTIEPGRLYEIGYPQCVCPEVLSGKTSDPSHCECSRQSVIYILGELMPEKTITVETIETILGGGGSCRFLATVQ